MLRAHGICLSSGHSTCTIDDFDIKCGVDDVSFVFRRKRSTTSVRPKLKIRFQIKVLKQSVRFNQCVLRCTVGNEQCKSICGMRFKQQAMHSVLSAKNKFQRIFNRRLPTAAPSVPRRRLFPVSGNPYRKTANLPIGRSSVLHRQTFSFRAMSPERFQLSRDTVRPVVNLQASVNPLSMMIGGMRLLPDPAGTYTSDDVIINCERGMAIANGICGKKICWPYHVFVEPTMYLTIAL